MAQIHPGNGSFGRLRLSFLLLVVTACLVPLLAFRLRDGETKAQEQTVMMVVQPKPHHEQPPLPTARSTILPFGARVACWPSTGGIFIKKAVPAEVEYLYLSLVNDSARPWPPLKTITAGGYYLNGEESDAVHPAAIEEDLFCEKMRLVGAQFWDLPADPSSLTLPIELSLPSKPPGELGMAWYSMADPAAMINVTEARQSHPGLMEEFDNASEMDERFAIIKRMGGLYCAAHEDLQRCKDMWCRQYPNHCYESVWLDRQNDAINRWAEYLAFPVRLPLTGAELESYGSDQWIRDDTSGNFRWIHASTGA